MFTINIKFTILITGLLVCSAAQSSSSNLKTRLNRKLQFSNIACPKECNDGTLCHKPRCDGCTMSCKIRWCKKFAQAPSCKATCTTETCGQRGCKECRFCVWGNKCPRVTFVGELFSFLNDLKSSMTHLLIFFILSFSLSFSKM